MLAELSDQRERKQRANAFATYVPKGTTLDNYTLFESLTGLQQPERPTGAAIADKRFRYLPA